MGGTGGGTDNAVLRADGTGGATVQGSSVSVTDDGDINIPTGRNITVNSAVPKRTLFLSAAGAYPATTTGCAAAALSEASTNKQNYYGLGFDTSADEYCCWTTVMPDNWDGGTVTAIFYWTATGGSGDVNFAIQGRAYANDDAIDQAYGTAVGVTDTLITAGDVHITAATGAVTIGGSPAGGQMVMWRVYRDVSEDNIAQDVLLLGVKIEYGVSAFSD